MVPGVMLCTAGTAARTIHRPRARDRDARLHQHHVDLRGHVRHHGQRETVSREDNLQDVLAAYDVGEPSAVDPSAIAIVGSSGGYLAAIVSALRRVRWLALRTGTLQG
jgi:hypothetical protein